ncbi:PorP/SprF family type IX secretion system membrane protein [Belliella aquatica]|uniref:Bacteroidetes-specific membrane protein n=1 Tax=Belliella aquatica TaxID=1323734 RepID=A0ABQ1MZG1_9BACT|nr:PorP/SprF family type IX secretion system membrane protein [Belliella aquatica]MCH7407347.1 PorP/SprF family type IX secretion system membrane protein [Belliella aquatica]GGC49485.1 hypothetical protein GCM10010993_29980 [Belliella aquatica]
MKKIFLLTLFITFISLASYGQGRRYMSQFNHFQNYFNAGMTGYEGSTIKGFVRNQWSGFDGAPQLYYLSTELDFSEMRGDKDAALIGQNAVGVNFLSESYGAFLDTEIQATYAARIRVSRNANLRLGAAITYANSRLDGNSLNTEQANDPTVSQYLNSFANMGIVDFNLGLALTHQNYYIGYSMQNINQGSIRFGDVFFDKKPRVSVFQSGFRQAISSTVSIASHVMYRAQNDLPNHFEANIKGIFLDKIWLGVGHRVDYANNFTFGVVHNQIKLGYTHEIPTNKSYLIPQPTHEFIATFSLWRKYGKAGDDNLVIW